MICYDNSEAVLHIAVRPSVLDTVKPDNRWWLVSNSGLGLHIYFTEVPWLVGLGEREMNIWDIV